MPRFYPFDVIGTTSRPLSARLQELRFVGRGTYIRPLQAFRDLRRAEEKARAQGHEGIIVKAAGSPYVEGTRSKHWLKFKFTESISAIVVGFTESSGLLTTLSLALINGDQPIEVGKIASGWTHQQGRNLINSIQQGEIVIVDVEYLPSRRDELKFGTFRGVRTDLNVLDANYQQLIIKE